MGTMMKRGFGTIGATLLLGCLAATLGSQSALAGAEPQGGGAAKDDPLVPFEIAAGGTRNIRILLNPEDELTAGTCNMPGASLRRGDTVLTVLGPDGNQVAQNDDYTGCGLASYLQVIAQESGLHVIQISCFGGGRCSGVLSYQVVRGGL